MMNRSLWFSSVAAMGLITCVAVGSAMAQAGKGLGDLPGSVSLQQVTAFEVDQANACMKFTVMLKNDLKHTVYLKELKLTGVRLVKEGEALPIGTGSGTTDESIRPVEGFDAVNGMELRPGLSPHTLNVALDRDAASMGSNLIEIFNLLNAGSGSKRVSLLFSGNAKGGVRDPNGVEWTAISLDKRFSASFENLISFESSGGVSDFQSVGSGSVIISKIATARVVTRGDTRSLSLAVALENKSERDHIAMKNPKFSNIAFLTSGKKIPIGTGAGTTSETFVPADGFPAENGIELPPGTSTHSIDLPMADDDGAALGNLAAIMNVLGSPQERSSVSLLFAAKTSVGVKGANGMEGLREVEAQKKFKAVVKGEYLFE